MTITYELTLTITRPVHVDDDTDMLTDTAEWMVGPDAKRELEREVLRALRTCVGTCDVEVMDATVSKPGTPAL